MTPGRGPRNLGTPGVPPRRRLAAWAFLAAASLVSPRAAAAPQAPTAAIAPIPVVRVFTLRFRRAEEALLLVRPLLTENGSVVLQSRLNTLTVRDAPQAIERTAQALASYDVPPRAIQISVTLLKASSDAAKGVERRAVSDEIKGVGERLKKLFNFTDYNALDSVVVQGMEGESVAYAIGGEYKLEFFLDPSGDDATVRLKSLALGRLRKDAQGRDVWRDLVKTSLNVPVAQPYVLGIGKDEAASGALFLVFYASSRYQGPGITGVR